MKHKEEVYDAMNNVLKINISAEFRSFLLKKLVLFMRIKMHSQT